MFPLLPSCGLRSTGTPSRCSDAYLTAVSVLRHPDFTTPELAQAPDARFVPAPADGVLPENFFSTTNLPTYVRVGGEWRMPREPRMDAGIVLDADGALWIREGRRLKQGDRIAVGQAEDGSEGIYVHTRAFLGEDA